MALLIFCNDSTKQLKSVTPKKYRCAKIASVGDHSAFAAMGLGGQYISLFPGLNMVIIVTSDSRDVVPKYQGVVPKYAIASVTD
jgi:hypothetical protein